MPSNVGPVQLDLQFGAWDMPASTDNVGSGFSFGAPSIISQVPSANNTYTSPARYINWNTLIVLTFSFRSIFVNICGETACLTLTISPFTVNLQHSNIMNHLA